MKTIIAGSRTITDYQIVKTAIENSGWLGKITLIVSGCARGVDQLALRFARENSIPTAKFPANWKKYGKSAGHRRNADMADYADALIAVQLNNSPGTTNMIDTMGNRGKLVYIDKH